MGEVERDPEQPHWQILQSVKDTLLAPVRIALSPALLRTYARALILFLTSSTLFGIAVVAYVSFYVSYIPVRGISVPVYLQFDAYPQPRSVLEAPAPVPSRFPSGAANIAGLVGRQKYDVVVDVTLPRSEKNLGAGNWMVGVELRGPTTVGGGVKQMLGYGEEWDVDDFSQTAKAGKEKEGASGDINGKDEPVVLARSRRPAILTYRSWMTEFAYRALRLPLYMIGWGEESEKVQIKMMEGVEFDKGWRNVPASLRLEIRSRTSLEVYKVAVRVVARLEGLRWIMYHYRLTSFAIFTALFWATEMTIFLSTWAAFSLLFGNAGHAQEPTKHKTIKQDEDDSSAATPKPLLSEPTTPYSDTARTFPTLPSQQPLHYAGGPESSSSTTAKLKEERQTPGLEDIPTRTEADADVEDEDEDADFILDEPVPGSAVTGMTDSGIGTSMESGRDGLGVVRRRSGGKRGR